MTEASRRRRLLPLFSWRSALADSDLHPTTRHVALALSLYMNERGGSAFPGAALLAHDTGYSESTVREHLQRLVTGSWLVLLRQGGQKGAERTANEYQATIPQGTQQTLLDPDEEDDEDGRPLREPDGSGIPTGLSDGSDPSGKPLRPLREPDPISSLTHQGTPEHPTLRLVDDEEARRIPLKPPLDETVKALGARRAQEIREARTKVKAAEPEEEVPDPLSVEVVETGGFL